MESAGLTENERVSKSPVSRRLTTELGELALLGGPITLSYLGNQAMGFVDTAMVGRLDASSLAAVGIGNGIYFTLTLVGMGVVMGMDPLVSQAEGAGERDRSRVALWQAARLALWASIPVMLLVGLCAFFTDRIGIDAVTARLIFLFIVGRLPNALTFLFVTAGRIYLQSIGQTRSLIWATVWMNLANLAGNTVLIFGDDGLEAIGLPRIGAPALGVLGSGLASSFASIAGLFVIFRAVVKQVGFPTRDDVRTDRKVQKEIVRLGMPIGMHLLAEVGAFSVAGIFAGWLGPQAAAGHQVALGLASLSFTMALGISNATSILVGRAVGRGDTPGARRAGLVGIAAGTVAMGVSAILFAMAPWACARVLSNKPDILEAAVPLIRIAAVFQLADAVQAVAAGALRGAGDTHSARNANMLGYYVLGLPLSLLLGFGFKLGAVGIWWGLTAALFAVAIALLIRFFRLSASEIRRI